MPVAGNGNALGLTDGAGSTVWGGHLGNSVINLQALGDDWSQRNGIFTKASIDGNTLGIVTNPTKSGLIAGLGDIDIGEVNSMKLGKYILKY